MLFSSLPPKDVNRLTNPGKLFTSGLSSLSKRSEYDAVLGHPKACPYVISLQMAKDISIAHLRLNCRKFNFLDKMKLPKDISEDHKNLPPLAPTWRRIGKRSEIMLWRMTSWIPRKLSSPSTKKRNRSIQDKRGTSSWLDQVNRASSNGINEVATVNKTRTLIQSRKQSSCRRFFGRKPCHSEVYPQKPRYIQHEYEKLELPLQSTL